MSATVLARPEGARAEPDLERIEPSRPQRIADLGGIRAQFRIKNNVKALEGHRIGRRWKRSSAWRWYRVITSDAPTGWAVLLWERV